MIHEFVSEYARRYPPMGHRLWPINGEIEKKNEFKVNLFSCSVVNYDKFTKRNHTSETTCFKQVVSRNDDNPFSNFLYKQAR